MDAAVLYEYGSPRFGTFPDPEAHDSLEVVTIVAAALSRFDILYASGQHYVKPIQLPCVAGREGIGRLANNKRIYFDEPVSPYGSMAQKTLVDPHNLIEVPEGVEDAVAAALGNSGLAAWLPLQWRANLQPGETVLILGATGIVGQIAVQAAKLLGAGWVIAAGRNREMLQRLQELGADATVNIATENLHPAIFQEAAEGGIDVILDYGWGNPGLVALQAAAVGARLIQIGVFSNDEISISAALVRSKCLSILGYANFHASFAQRASAYQQMAELTRTGKLIIPVKPIPLQEIEQAWAQRGTYAHQRLVLIP